ncbi:MAG: response regulator, partial [Bacteroidales bacterium]|nr:response regulator [Bacteroidales bacterium]
FFSDIKAFFNLKLIEKNIDFIIDIDPSLPVSIYIDELRLRQILINLLGNAIKFTHKGYVKLFVKAKPKRKYTKNKSKEIIDLYIDVEDTGIGISSEFIDQIFDSFSQQEYQTSKKFGGTGLGLAISKRLIKMMNGTINVKSEINKGSIFSILLKNVQISRSKTFFKQEEITFQNNIKFKKSKIIIVDDVESNRKYLANALKNLEMEVYEADNGQVALTIIKKIIPDLVITDLKMPVIDGFQLLDEIKNKKELKHIPVIAISASFLEINNEKYKNAKFSSYLMKPLQLGILCRELSKYLPHELLEKGKQIKPVHQQKISKTDEIKILNTLEKDFYKTWEKFSRQQPIDEVEKFSKALIKVGKDYNINNIIEYGEKLLITINNFDIDFMLKLLNDFPILIKKFKHN